MLRRSGRFLVGVEGDIFMSAIKDKKYLEHRLATLGRQTQQFHPLSDEELTRFTTSVGSPENLFNKKDGCVPGLVVGEDGKVEGCNLPDPTRYGDWEYNGRCYDF